MWICIQYISVEVTFFKFSPLWAFAARAISARSDWLAIPRASGIAARLRGAAAFDAISAAIRQTDSIRLIFFMRSRLASLSGLFSCSMGAGPHKQGWEAGKPYAGKRRSKALWSPERGREERSSMFPGWISSLSVSLWSIGFIMRSDATFLRHFAPWIANSLSG